MNVARPVFAGAALLLLLPTRRIRPPTSPPTLVGGADACDDDGCSFSAAICSADLTASMVVVVWTEVPSSFTVSARMRATASFINGYIAAAAAISSGDAPAIIGPASALA